MVVGGGSHRAKPAPPPPKIASGSKGLTYEKYAPDGTLNRLLLRYVPVMNVKGSQKEVTAQRGHSQHSSITSANRNVSKVITMMTARPA